jgi:hypothetical protein
MNEPRKKGRKPKPKRTVVNIVTRIDGKRKHYHSFTIQVEPYEVMKLLQDAYPTRILR